MQSFQSPRIWKMISMRNDLKNGKKRVSRLAVSPFLAGGSPSEALPSKLFSVATHPPAHSDDSGTCPCQLLRWERTGSSQPHRAGVTTLLQSAAQAWGPKPRPGERDYPAGKGTAFKPKDLSSITQTHMVGEPTS